MAEVPPEDSRGRAPVAIWGQVPQNQNLNFRFMKHTKAAFWQTSLAPGTHVTTHPLVSHLFSAFLTGFAQISRSSLSRPGDSGPLDPLASYASGGCSKNIFGPGGTCCIFVSVRNTYGIELNSIKFAAEKFGAVSSFYFLT